MKIVSANYLNRNSDLKWLWRGSDAPAEAAVPVKALTATGVRFVGTRSDSYEAGFGCGIIAECEEATPLAESPAIPTSAQRIRFNGFETFYLEDHPRHCEVKSVGILYLTEDGKMYGDKLELGEALA